jgi:hypothetical protein
MSAPSPVIASPSWIPSRSALLLRDSSFANRFLLLEMRRTNIKVMPIFPAARGTPGYRE